MIRTGRFGNVDARENIQITLDESQMIANQQSIEFFDTTNFTKSYNRSLGVAKPNFYYNPIDYDATTTFKKYDYTKEGVDRDTVQLLKTAGYSQPSQVQHSK